MRRRDRALWFSGLLTLASAIVITWLSGQDSGQSNTLSRELTAWALSLLSLEKSVENMELFNLILRKLAHFTFYFLLGLGLTGLVRNWKRVPSILAVIVLGGLFAASDEFHQRFSQGRVPNGWDVLLDTCGAAAGWLCSEITKALKMRNHPRR